jgi:enoyl-CoA hydratase
MDGSRVSYVAADGVALVTLDDGKANALSPAMQADIHAALDRAAADRAVVVLKGRAGRFSGGFDLKVMGAAGPEAVAMVRGGFELAERLLTFPRPVVIACTGHAIAMGAFLLLAGDWRVGAAGPYKIAANEVAIGLTMPRAAIELARQRLSPAHLHRSLLLAEEYAPEGAVAAGYLDELAPDGEVEAAARRAATRLGSLSLPAFTGTRQRTRGPALAALRSAIEADDADLSSLLTARARDAGGEGG